MLRATAKKVIPEPILRELRSFRALNTPERLAYLRARCLPQNRHLTAPPAQARSFLFVCFGNIIRSPLCEALMKRAVCGRTDFTITSAGTNAVPGRPVHPWAVAAARELGLSLDHHRAKSITPEAVDSADLILVMDYQNCAQILSRYKNAQDKVIMLRSYASRQGDSAEIRDPYDFGLEAVLVCSQLLKDSVTGLVRALDVTETASNSLSTF